MDPSELKRLLTTVGVDVWSLIDTAISMAAAEGGGDELRSRRDAIVQRLYADTRDRCLNCSAGVTVDHTRGSNRRPPPVASVTPPSPESMDGDSEGEEEEENRSSVDDEKTKVVAIRDFLEDSDQSDESIGSLLQNLLDMDITFRALKDTDIGRQVNGLRKHPCGEVRRLAKLLVRKWKDIVDEWVKSSPNCGEIASPTIITDGESPQDIPRKLNQNGQQIQELGQSLNTQNSYLSNGVESTQARAKAAPPPPRREAPAKSSNSTTTAASTSAVKGAKDIMLDPDRLASARKRLQENYQEAENARKQRTIQVMDIHEIPKPKNSLARKGGFQSKH